MKEKDEKADLFERVGDATMRFSRSLVYHGLGALITAIKGGKEARVRVGEAQKGVSLYSAFEKRGVDYVDFVILKAQVAALLLLLSSVAFVFDLIGLQKFALVAAPLGAYSVLLVQREVRKEFSEDFAAYREFFYSYAFISLLLVIVKAFKPRVDAVTPYLHLVAISLVAVTLFSVAFRRRYGRDYTFGKVLKGGGVVTVKVNYDIRANVKPGIHELRGGKGLKKGSIVKLKVEHGFLNLRGGRITGLAK